MREIKEDEKKKHGENKLCGTHITEKISQAVCCYFVCLEKAKKKTLVLCSNLILIFSFLTGLKIVGKRIRMGLLF